jgi:hypothetical protein
VQADYKAVTDRYIMSSTKITIYLSTNLFGGECGKSISRSLAICIFRRSGSNLDAQLCRLNGGRALVNINVGDVSVVEWCCIWDPVHTAEVCPVRGVCTVVGVMEVLAVEYSCGVRAVPVRSVEVLKNWALVQIAKMLPEKWGKINPALVWWGIFTALVWWGMTHPVYFCCSWNDLNVDYP